jgi:YD repeat-containing protein
MPQPLRRVLRIARFVILGACIVFGGPLTSGGFWLTSHASVDRTPIKLPWLEPYHQGGIDFATGLYVRTDQDVIEQGGDLPIVLKRTYRTADEMSRAFGVGATHNGEWYLRGDGQRFQWIELILDDGARIRYERTSWGNWFINAMFEHTGTPSVFYRSRVGWTGLQWALRWFDGSVAIFRACGPGGTVCSIKEMRSPDGLKVQYIRDADTQNLRAIRSGAAEVLLDYDGQNRVIRASSTGGAEVKYAYDAGGRLARVTEPGGIVRTYTYDARGAMLTIDEPRWHIENAYDADGRCVHQLTRWPDGRTAAIRVDYEVRDGLVVKASKSWDDGPKTVYHFNKQRYVDFEERDPTGPAPVVIHYRRNVNSNISTGVTVRCYDARGKLRRKADSEYKGASAIDALVATTCTE